MDKNDLTPISIGVSNLLIFVKIVVVRLLLRIFKGKKNHVRNVLFLYHKPLSLFHIFNLFEVIQEAFKQLALAWYNNYFTDIIS